MNRTSKKNNSMHRRPRMVMRQRTKLSRRTIATMTTGALLTIVSAVIIFINVTDKRQTYAASNGDYRSKASGNWSSSGTWEKFNGTNWVAASSAPSWSDGTIEILSGHTVTLTQDATVDQLIIDAGANIIINSSRYLYTNNGSGTDLVNKGTITVNGYLTEGLLTTLVDSGTIINSGTTQIGVGSTLTIAAGGRFTNSSGSIPTTLGFWVVDSGGVFEHNRNGSSLPFATWNTGSTCEITGATTSAPNNMNQTFYNLTWNCASQSANINLGADPSTVNGDFKVISTSTKQLKYNAAGATFTIGGNYNQSGGDFLLSSNNNVTSTLNIAGNFVQSGGTFSGVSGNSGVAIVNVTGQWSLTGGTISASGNPQSATQLTFNKPGVQTFNTTGTTMSGNVNYTVNSGTTLDLGTGTLTGSGNFTLQSGGGLMITSANGITSSGASGTIQVTGTRSFSSGANYTYNGSSSQVTGNGLPSNVNNLIISNSSGVTLSSDVTVSGILTLTSGKVTTGSNELKVTNTSASAITGYSSSSYVIGNLRRSVIGTGSYDYPLGTSANYEFVNITLASSTGFADILGTFTNANPVDVSQPLTNITVSGTPISAMLDYGYWTLTPNSSMTGGSYSVTLKEKGHTNSASDAAAYCVLKRANVTSAWQSLGTHSNSTQSESGGVATAARSGLTSFSNFGIGRGGGALPIELIYFKAQLNSEHYVDLSWATASEINNDHFTVESSSDGIHFEELLRKPGAGNTTSTRYYTDVDENPLDGYSYYRLKQTDYDGRFTYSEIKTVKYKAGTDDVDESELKIVSVYPNPFSEKFTISFMLKTSAMVEIQLYNSSGQMVFKDKMNSNDGMNQYDFTDQQGLTKGIYFVNLIYNDQKQVQKLVKN
jgi:hypothetical protein